MTFDLEDAKKRGCLCGGYRVRIGGDTLRGDRPIIGIIDYGEHEYPHAFAPDGSSYAGVRLQNLPPVTP